MCNQLTAEDEQAFEALWRCLGLSVDWSHTYTTIGEPARRAAQRAFLGNLARGDAQPGVDLRFLPVQQGEIVIAKDVFPAVPRRGERRQHRVVAPPLAVDGVAEVHAEIERAGIEMFDRGAELGDRSAIRARASVRDVRILRIGDDPDLEAFAPRRAADERRDGYAERELAQESTAGQRRGHALIKQASGPAPMKKGGIAPAL